MDHVVLKVDAWTVDAPSADRGLKLGLEIVRRLYPAKSAAKGADMLT